MNAPTIVKTHEGEPVSPDLAPLLLAVYDELAKRSSDLRPLKVVIERLLTFLSSPAGRTNANCWAADLFFALDEGWGDVDWEHVPEALGDILSDIGSALHDTVQAPDVAENFDCTPEHLLTRLRTLEISKGAV
jgi:hypothetical protein